MSWHSDYKKERMDTVDVIDCSICSEKMFINSAKRLQYRAGRRDFVCSPACRGKSISEKTKERHKKNRESKE